jgi:hypothetical protein
MRDGESAAIASFCDREIKDVEWVDSDTVKSRTAENPSRVLVFQKAEARFSEADLLLAALTSPDGGVGGASPGTALGGVREPGLVDAM